MAGLDLNRLVLLECTQPADPAAGHPSPFYTVGTGYFVTDDLVLTAQHVVGPHTPQALRLRVEAESAWFGVDPVPVWADATLDAALLRVEPAGRRKGLAPLLWAQGDSTDELKWTSAGYPTAGTAQQDGSQLRKTRGLGGTLYGAGGGGQGRKTLDLGVAFSVEESKLWRGASGAPVLAVDTGALLGLITQVPEDFGGDRFDGLPVSVLLGDPGFSQALQPRWKARPLLPTQPWVLVVLSEDGGDGLATWVDKTLASRREQNAQRASVLGEADEPLEAVTLRITDALQSPADWLDFVRTLCLAPFAVFDATGFEPGVMLALGVRAVVRRGVTLTSTAELLGADELAQLPFNIKESKLLYHGDGYATSDARHPLQTLGAALRHGRRELRAQPRYLDLPAYDGVRCPMPERFKDDANQDVDLTRTMLVLCPFNDAWEGSNWVTVSNAAGRFDAARRLVRMRDVLSPRLVGQALYEAIRWSQTCIVDWTLWRPNVFFELGVRLASAEVGPVCLAEAGELANDNHTLAAEQRRRLVQLLQPQAYAAPGDKPGKGRKPQAKPHHANGAALANLVDDAFKRHKAIAGQQPETLVDGALAHNATFLACRDAFDTRQERFTLAPHEALRNSIAEVVGRDPQNRNRDSDVLFAGNPAFKAQIAHNVRERWIAAWYYLANRQPRTAWATDSALRQALRALGNDVLQNALQNPSEPALQALRDEIFDVVDALDEIDKLPTAAGVPPP